MNVDKTLRISILGKSYTVVTDESEADVFAAVAALDQSLQKKVAGAAAYPLEKVGIVAALELALENMRLKRKLIHYEDKCSDLVLALADGVNK